MIAPLKIQPKPDLDARLAFAACALDGHCFIGWRHDLILRDDIKPRGLRMTQECQGFVDDRGCFWSREVSAQIAYRARQIARPAETIMSEELWDPDGTPRDGWKPDDHREQPLAAAGAAPAAPAAVTEEITWGRVATLVGEAVMAGARIRGSDDKHLTAIFIAQTIAEIVTGKSMTLCRCRTCERAAAQPKP